jgi:ADP-heptose:LPS heptosyltransferase
MKFPENILVIRNDKLGDFLLALPAFAALRIAFPNAQITAFVPEYTADIARLMRDIDKIFIDPGRGSGLTAWAQTVTAIREHSYDIALTLFSTFYTGSILWAAGVPYRMAPATKLAQIFYNRRVTQRRSRSEKPEYQYNLDLVRAICSDAKIEYMEPQGPYLAFTEEELSAIRGRFFTAHGLPSDSKYIVIHPGHGGSANNLTPVQYANLTRLLYSISKIIAVITAGPSEQSVARAVSGLLPDIPHIVHNSTSGLVEFSKLLANAALFVGGSTGPLHIAGALDIPTAAFYPRERATSALRWQTLNSPERRLVFTPPREQKSGSDMSNIDLDEAAHLIAARFLYY